MILYNFFLDLKAMINHDPEKSFKFFKTVKILPYYTAQNKLKYYRIGLFSYLTNSTTDLCLIE